MSKRSIAARSSLSCALRLLPGPAPTPLPPSSGSRLVTRPAHAQMSEYCLCQRVKKEVFSSEKDFTDAVLGHHAVMQAAMKAKQNMDLGFADALDHAVDDVSKMYTKA